MVASKLRWLVPCALLVAFGWSSDVRAADEPGSQQRVLAQALFMEGQALLEQGQLDQACPKLEESLRLEVAGGTLLNLARCHELQGRTATAWAEYQGAYELARSSNRRDRMTTAKQKVEELDAALSRVRFELAPHEMALEFLLDGVQINEAALAQPLPLDPGKHELRVGSSGWETVTVNFIVSTEERESSVVVPIPLKRLGPASTIDSPPSPSVVSKPAWPLPLALVTGGLGLGSLAVAAGFGVDAFNQANTVLQHCPNLLCDPTGEEALADGRQSAVVSNATAIVGGALSGLSIVFFVIAATAGGEPEPAPIPVQVNFDANAIQISARWLL